MEFLTMVNEPKVTSVVADGFESKDVETQAPQNAELKYWLLGGAGIFMGIDIATYGKTRLNKQAEFVGLDTSKANGSNGLFPIERMEGTSGSGKDIAENYPGAASFIDLAMSKHKPGRFNVIVCSSSGGTGSMFSVVLARWFLKRQIPFVVAIAEDHTSETEFKNAMLILKSLLAQTTKDQFNLPICSIRIINAEDKTRGEVNREMVTNLDYLSYFLTESNDELDFKDIQNLLAYSTTTKVPATLTELDFHDKQSSIEYNGATPVGVCSLFDHRNNVIPRFKGSVVRSTGVMNLNNNFPDGMTELHMTLHHGDLLGKLEKELAKLDDVKIANQNAFKSDTTKVLDSGADDNGMFFG